MDFDMDYDAGSMDVEESDVSDTFDDVSDEGELDFSEIPCLDTDIESEELELEDPEQYILEKFKDKELKYEKSVQEDGTIVFDITTSGIRQRYSFTEI